MYPIRSGGTRPCRCFVPPGVAGLSDAVDGEDVDTVCRSRRASAMFARPANRIVLTAGLRKVAIARGAVPVLNCAASSRNVTSLPRRDATACPRTLRFSDEPGLMRVRPQLVALGPDPFGGGTPPRLPAIILQATAGRLP